MLTSIASILQQQCGLDASSPVIVAVSGGPDSLCLMDVLQRAGYPIVIAHFNHKLREDADSDAATVQRLAERLNLPVVVGQGDVRMHAAETKQSIEEASRNLRYKFLFEQAHLNYAQAVAVGHTADDQVETMLMHLLRGAGLKGLKGMTYRTVLPVFDTAIPIVRPLLDVWREETVVYCAGQGLRPVHDPSNESLNFMRNRIRHLLIPALETYNPKFREAAWRTSQLLSADHEIVRDAVNAAWQHVVAAESNDLVVFDASQFVTQSIGVQRHLIRHAMEMVVPEEEATYVTLERAVEFLAGNDERSALSLPGDARLLCEEGRIYMASRNAILPFERWPQLPSDVDSMPLPVPGELLLPGGWRITCERWNIPVLAWEQAQGNDDPYQTWIDVEGQAENLYIRIRRDGDRFEPLGLGGHTQKLSDFFTNVKLPQRARDRWPLLASEEDIIWIPGYQLSERYRLTRDSRQILYLTLAPPLDKSTSVYE